MDRIIRVTLVGAESTGKSALAARLAEHYATVWVPEYAREYLAQKNGLRLKEYMVPIALGHVALDARISRQARTVVFGDSCLLATFIWSEYYFHSCDRRIIDLLERERYDLYLLLDIDIPWVNDGLRDAQVSRHVIHNRLQSELVRRKLPYVLIAGDFQNRLKECIKTVDNLLCAASKTALTVDEARAPVLPSF